MVRTLLILRHAKAEHGVAKPDFDRELTERGRQDAQRMGKAIRKLDLVPEKILCSPAARAQQTMQQVCGKLRAKPTAASLAPLYPGEVASVVAAIETHAEGKCVLLIGHNPGLEALANRLTGAASGIVLPTSGLACLDLEISEWSHLEAEPATLRWLLSPEVVDRL